MFPIDAITIRLPITGTGNIILASSTRTILNISFQKQTTSKDLFLYCNTDIVASLYSSVNTYDFPVQYLCNGTLTFSTSGSGSNLSTMLLTYINRDIRITSEPIIITSTTSENFINGFSYGSVITSMLLIFIFTLMFFKTIKEWIFGMKVEGVANTKTLVITRKRQ